MPYIISAIDFLTGSIVTKQCKKPQPEWEDRKNGTELFQSINSRVKKAFFAFLIKYFIPFLIDK